MKTHAEKPTHHTIQYGQQRIHFALLQNSRRDLRITVYPDKQVSVIAPLERKLDEILLRVIRRAPWIVRQLDRFERYRPLPTPREYISGESHLYMGRQYRLKILKSDTETVKLAGRFIHIRTPDRSDQDRIHAQLDAWYVQRARDVFARRLAGVMTASSLFKQTTPPWSILKMKKRWGSCTCKGRILLNPELVKAPVHCIDYVLVHELCHIREPNHGPKFYRLLARVMPNWAQRKERLESVATVFGHGG